MAQFKITEEMRNRAYENKEGLESKYIDTMRTYAIAFCDEFYRDITGNFDTWGNFDCETYIMYIWDVRGETVIIDGELRWDTVEEFLDIVEECENRIIAKRDRAEETKMNMNAIRDLVAELYDSVEDMDMSEYNKMCIFDQLASIQNLAK